MGNNIRACSPLSAPTSGSMVTLHDDVINTARHLQVPFFFLEWPKLSVDPKANFSPLILGSNAIAAFGKSALVSAMDVRFERSLIVVPNLSSNNRSLFPFAALTALQASI